jgi:hypothetical protein
MASNSVKIWPTACLITIYLVLPACSTTSSSSQPPVTPKPPTSSNQHPAESDTKASQTTQSSDEKAQQAASKADSVEADGNKVTGGDTAGAGQVSNRTEGAGPQTDRSAKPTLPDLPAALPATKTEQEKALELDQKLNKSLTTFDGKLLKERQMLEGQETSAGSGGTQDGAATAGTPGSEIEAGSVIGENPEGSPSAGEKPQVAPQRGSSTSQRGGKPHTPPDIPDGHGDDIVARQLREAAENETDPVLREKLWEEYKKYKRGGGS